MDTSSIVKTIGVKAKRGEHHQKHHTTGPRLILGSIFIAFAIALLFAGVFFSTGCKDEPSGPTKEEIVLPPCDNDITLDDDVALDGVRAIDICKQTPVQNEGWGVLGARYIRADGSDAVHSAQIGIMDAFGGKVTPKRGSRLLVLSTGRARTPGQASACGSINCSGYGVGTAPAGFPQQTTGCPAPAGTIYDDIGLEITLRAPKSAKGFALDFMYFTFEYPNFVCSSFNDQFAIIMESAPAGSFNGNIALDSANNPISVNCNYMSAANDSLLAGTGFDTWGAAGTTGWIRATAPVESGQEFILRLIIWDTGDDAIDASVVLDNFQWLTTTTITGTSKL